MPGCVKRLKITNLRNLSQVSVTPCDGFNLISGENGSGKTSLLESLYLLGMGRSFRTHLTGRVIQNECDSLCVFAEILPTSGGAAVKAGAEWSRQDKLKLKLSGENVGNVAEIAAIFPVQVINADAYQLLTDGPRYRRQFFDWGVFHVEPSFFPLWQSFQRVSKQRNAALKSGVANAQVQAWDAEFCTISEKLTSLRDTYIEQLKPLFFKNFAELLTMEGIELGFWQGWKKESSLKEVLQQSFNRDRELTYTQYGPQRADLRITKDKVPVQDVLSRGQQKLLVFALRLAQGQLLYQQCQKHCLFLIDDLPAELDRGRQLRVMQTLKAMNVQVFITGVELYDLCEGLAEEDYKLFHVEHGMVSEREVV